MADRTRWHRVTNADPETLIGDCSMCGQGVPVRPRVRGRNGRPYFECPEVSHNRSPHYQRMHKFGITEEDYNRLLADQGGGCAICGRPAISQALDVDHDHACCPSRKSCGKCIRGLLCRRCNSAIGYLNDDPDIVLRASVYLVSRTAKR